MKNNKYYILLFLFIFSILKCKACNVNDSSKIKSIAIYICYFNSMSRVQLDEYSLMKMNWSKRNIKHKPGFDRILTYQESVPLEEKVNLLLKSDTINGVIDKNMDLRYLMVLNYEGNKPPVYIGMEGELNGYMFINGKKYKRDKMFLVVTLPYITDKDIKSHIKKVIKNWKDI
jgi:hypothetical protein